jgi:hypothetical protein
MALYALGFERQLTESSNRSTSGILLRWRSGRRQKITIAMPFAKLKCIRYWISISRIETRLRLSWDTKFRGNHQTELSRGTSVR